MRSALRVAKTNATPRAGGGDPVSPELALVDPELARTERARLLEAADSERLVELSTLDRGGGAPLREPESTRTLASLRAHSSIHAARRRLLPAAVLVSMFAGGVVLSMLVTHQHLWAGDRVAAVTPDASSRANGGSAQAGSSRQVQGVSGSTSADANAERAILSAVLRSPKRNLPRQLVDPTTGLLKNNVHTRCRRSGGSRSFFCVIRPPGRPAGEGLYVRYSTHRGSRAAFAWYGYHNG